MNHAIGVDPDASGDHVELEALQRHLDTLGAVLGIGQHRRVFSGRIADHERHALFGERGRGKKEEQYKVSRESIHGLPVLTSTSSPNHP